MVDATGIGHIVSHRVRWLIDRRMDGNIRAASAKADVGYAVLYRIYHGETREPPASALVKIARAFRVSLDWLTRELPAASERGAAPLLDYGDDQADELVEWLSQPQSKRRWTVSERIKEAYGVAADRGFSVRQFEVLDTWRNHLLAQQENDSSDEPGSS